MNPRFTILTAVYNAQAYVAECIESVLSQTCAEWQMICIDDCSTDESKHILHQYAARDSRIQVMQTKVNSGQAVARNVGLKVAKGEFTLMLDADDLLSPDALESVWRAHLRHPEVDTFLFRLERFDDAGWSEVEPLVNGHITLSGRDACLRAINWRIHGYFAIRTDLHQRLPYDESLRVYGDDVTSRLHLFHSRAVGFCPGRYRYRQHGASCTHHFSVRRIDFVRANTLMRQLLEERHADGDLLRCCEAYAWRIYVAIFREMIMTETTLSPTEREQCERYLNEHLTLMRPSRLPWSLRLHPSFLFLRPYKLFKGYQTRLLALRKLIKGKKQD